MTSVKVSPAWSGLVSLGRRLRSQRRYVHPWKAVQVRSALLVMVTLLAWWMVATLPHRPRWWDEFNVAWALVNVVVVAVLLGRALMYWWWSREPIDAEPE